MERLARLKLLVTIVDRPRGEVVARICGGLGVHLHLGMLGRGTASSEVLDFLGLGETDKAVILTLAPEPLVPLIRGELVRGLHLRRPGKGILFTLPLSGISRRAAACLSRPVPEETTEGARGMEENRGAGGYRYELIVASVDQGQTDQVMDAARSAGAAGGTLLHARRAGVHEAEKFYGISLQKERELVAILAPRAQKAGIMRAIAQSLTLEGEQGGVVFSLPVDSIEGLAGAEPLE